MLSIEQMTIDAYIGDSDIYCRECGEKRGLPSSQALSRYDLYNFCYDGASCGDCCVRLVDDRSKE